MRKFLLFCLVCVAALGLSSGVASAGTVSLTPVTPYLIPNSGGDSWYGQWSGGCIGGVTLDEDFRYVISLYPWERYSLPPGCVRTEIEMYGAGELPALEPLNEAIDAVIYGMGRGKTLVHCQAGLNRSGLVAALALVHGAGMSGAEAIDLLREKRSPMVLCNEAFENHVRSF